MHELGHIPAEGDTVMIGDIMLSVKKMDRNRIDTLTLTLPEK
jgi:CBS domain containing-hemolysin-like protein